METNNETNTEGNLASLGSANTTATKAAEDYAAGPVDAHVGYLPETTEYQTVFARRLRSIIAEETARTARKSAQEELGKLRRNIESFVGELMYQVGDNAIVDDVAAIIRGQLGPEFLPPRKVTVNIELEVPFGEDLYEVETKFDSLTQKLSDGPFTVFVDEGL